MKFLIYKVCSDFLDGLQTTIDVLNFVTPFIQVQHSEKTIEGLAEVDIVVDDEDSTRIVKALAHNTAGAVFRHFLYLVAGLQGVEKGPINCRVIFLVLFMIAG